MGLVLGRGFCGLHEQFDEVLCEVKNLLWELCDVKKLLWDVKKLFICDDSIQGWGVIAMGVGFRFRVGFCSYRRAEL